MILRLSDASKEQTGSAIHNLVTLEASSKLSEALDSHDREELRLDLEDALGHIKEFEAWGGFDDHEYAELTTYGSLYELACKGGGFTPEYS